VVRRTFVTFIPANQQERSVSHSAFHITLSINENEHFGLAAPQHGARYHQQDNHDTEMYCGAATAQIVLDSIGVPLADLDQDLLYASHKAFGAPDPAMNWFTAPDGLQGTLNDRKPANFPGTFKLWALESEEAISRKLCWAIVRGVAPIALVQNGLHWIVVVGFEASAVPTSSTDTSYEILSFDVYNPWPHTPRNTVPPPHVHGSDNCGTGFTTGKNRGDEYETIAYKSPGGAGGEYWSTHYMTKVPRGNWQGKYLAVCDEDPPVDTQDSEIVLNASLVTDLDEIRTRATAGLATSNNARRVPWVRGLAGVQVASPILVEREDFDPLRFYYIVPIYRDSDVPVLTMVDAYEQGGLVSTVVAPDGTTHFSYALDRDAVLRRFVGQEIEVKEGVVRLEEQDLHEHLVWQPCAESLSPYWPFYRFDVGGPESGIRVYVRIDGEVFTELRFGAGM
jgi:hypothetical protein